MRAFVNSYREVQNCEIQLLSKFLELAMARRLLRGPLGQRHTFHNQTTYQITYLDQINIASCIKNVVPNGFSYQDLP
jgi:hypothetical protein